MAGLSLTARFRTHAFAIHLTAADPTLGQVATAIASATGADAETIKLTIPGRKGHLLRPTADPSLSSAAAGKRCLRLAHYPAQPSANQCFQ